jgi:hypothetical protein
MQSTDIPVKFPIPFANGAGPAFIRDIPTASQIGIDDGAASLTDGFPPLNFQPIASGGIPPAGEDFNGVLFRVTGWARWIAAGGPVTFDAALSTAIGGYPRGAFLQSAVTPGLFFVSTVENNTTNPDAGGANWTPAIPAKASGAEVLAGSNDAKFVTPLGVAALRATAAEILAGSDGRKYISPLELRTATPWASGSPGYMVHPNGFLEQWGLDLTFRTGEGFSSISYPIAFANNVFNVCIGTVNNSGSNQRDLQAQWRPDGSLTTLTFYRQGEGGGGENMEGVWWRAIGN